MEDTGGAAPGKGGTHEQDHSHPEAQCPAVLRGGAGICGAVCRASGLSAVGTAGGAGAAVLAFAGAKKNLPPRVVETEVPFHTGVDDVDAMLTEMQQQLDTLHALNEALPDPQLSAAMARMEKAGRSIVETVEATPAKAKQVRRLPITICDAVNVLQQYAKLAKQGVRGENAASIARRWSAMPPLLPRHLKISWMPCMLPRAWTFRQT